MLRGAWAAAGRRAALPLLAVALVQGCAVVTAPGFDYADAKNRNSITLGQYVPGDANNPPQGVITPITPQLVQAQQQARPRDVSGRSEAAVRDAPSPTPSARATSSASWCMTTPSCCPTPAR